MTKPLVLNFFYYLLVLVYRVVLVKSFACVQYSRTIAERRGGWDLL